MKKQRGEFYLAVLHIGLVFAFLLGKKNHDEDGRGGDDTHCKGDDIAQPILVRLGLLHLCFVGAGGGDFAAGAKGAGVAIDGGAVVPDVRNGRKNRRNL